LLDFGISKSLSQDNQSNTTNITKSGTVGTPRHMSPEQLHHEEKPITYSSDIYSLGIVFYEILSKQHPLINNGEISMPIPDFRWISKHLNQSPRLLSTICPDLPTNLVDLVMNMLAKEPTNRPSLDIIGNVLSNPSQPYKSLSLFTFETVKVDIKGKIIERKKKQARQYIEHLGNGVMLEMVEILAGEFMMGTSESDIEKVVAEYKRYGRSEEDARRWVKEETPQHKVRVEMFYIGKYQVTQEQWKEIMGDNPSYFKGEDKLPVENVSWEDSSKFCKKLSEKTGKEYRLASEAEWEYACRAGSQTPFAYGETINTEIVNYEGEHPYGETPKGGYIGGTMPVGSLGVANEFGLYDMHGNVWEWCQDEWHDNYNNAPTDGSAWENIPSNNTLRVLRGGSFNSLANACRSALRLRLAPDSRLSGLGLRVVMSARTLK
ncbi:MAG: SUMF1/EgtB/PvdO family nonheme iron enzyme, partial [Acidobacteria bacterium]|nr:SUMF1/EgtB/PvdO family nonheme iron enzyme [Acidobacteriota bacterium]